MRSKLLMRIFAIILIIDCMVCFTACDGGKNEPHNTASTASGDKTISDTPSVNSAGQEDIDLSQDDNTADTVSSKKKQTVVYEPETVEDVVIVDNKRSIKTYKNKWNIYEMLKSYTNSSSKVTEEQFLPSVGYMQAGKIVDTMFDTFAFLPSPSEEIDIPMDQKYILNYINNSLYREDCNVNALEKAVGTVKTALGKKDYKVNVFLPLFRPMEVVTDFGEYNGKKIDCSTEEGRLEALKWFIDTHISIFNSKKFKNLKLVGFYWFDEYAEQAHYSLIQKMNDYIHSKNYITNWSPFFNARGYSDWKKLKFDIATMQSNYFPGTPDGPNAGPIERLSTNSNITELNGMGMEMEASAFNTSAGIRGFKETMMCMLENGRIDFVHMYYIDNGPICVNEWYKHKTQYGQSVYHEMYRFIKRTLKSEDILF